MTLKFWVPSIVLSTRTLHHWLLLLDTLATYFCKGCMDWNLHNTCTAGLPLLDSTDWPVETPLGGIKLCKHLAWEYVACEKYIHMVYDKRKLWWQQESVLHVDAVSFNNVHTNQFNILEFSKLLIENISSLINVPATTTATCIEDSKTTYFYISSPCDLRIRINQLLDILYLNNKNTRKVSL